MLTASSMGSTAFQKGLGAIHSLSHPLNAQYNVHHGLSNAIFMPYVLTFNKTFIEKRIILICEYLNMEKNFETFLNWIMNLRKKLEIPHKITDIIDQKDINLDKLSKMALDDPSTSSNPRKLNVNDMRIMYEHSITGELFK
jgi:alcohol dehydrogenase class IV